MFSLQLHILPVLDTNSGNVKIDLSVYFILSTDSLRIEIILFWGSVQSKRNTCDMKLLWGCGSI